MTTSMPNRPGPDPSGTMGGLSVLIGAFYGIACYNCIEIYVLMFYTFRRKKTPYFWCIFISNTGIAIHEFCAFRLWGLSPNVAVGVFTGISWFLMTTGQSFVLYMRLHLVVQDRRKLHWVLAIIIFTTVSLQLPTGAMFIALVAEPPDRQNNLKPAYDIIRVVQLSGYLIQETFITGVYVYAFNNTSKHLRIIKHGSRRMLRELIALIILTVLFDIALIVNGLVGDYRIQTTLKPAIYSIKLKAELYVLNNLVSWSQSPSSSLDIFPPNTNERQQLSLSQARSENTSSSEPVSSLPSISTSERKAVGSNQEIAVAESGRIRLQRDRDLSYP